MTIANATRKNLLAALFVPAIALTGITAEAFSGNSDAQAQVAVQIQRATRTPGISDSGDGIIERQLRPCLPGTLTHVKDCTPWNPPRQVSSESECECQIKYQTINGHRVAVKDCYVLLPSNQVYYCENERLVRR